MEPRDLFFTPRTKDGQRLRLRISPEDMAKTGRGSPWQARVTDLDTGRRYDVIGADCGSPHCFCDAEVVRDMAPLVIDHERRKRVGVALANYLLLEPVKAAISQAERTVLTWIAATLAERPEDETAIALGDFASFGGLGRRAMDFDSAIGIADRLFELAHVACGECDEESVDSAVRALLISVKTRMGGL